MTMTTKQLNQLLYLLTKKLSGSNPTTKTTDLPYYDLLKSSYEDGLTYNDSQSSSTKGKLKNLSGLLKKLSGDTQPKYLTPWELLEQLPNMTLSELSTELNWLYNLYN
jgi:hypothetical protein